VRQLSFLLLIIAVVVISRLHGAPVDMCVGGHDQQNDGH